MADDSAGEKTQPATPKRRREARREGQVAKSADLTNAIVLLGTTLALYLYAGWFVDQVVQMMRLVMSNLHNVEVTDANVSAMGVKALVWLFSVVGPLMGIVFVLALGAMVVQVGFIVSTKPLMPKLSRFNPITGMQRLFGIEGVMKFVQGVLKMLIIGSVVAWTFLEELPQLHLLIDMSVAGILGYMGRVTFLMAIRTALLLLAIGLADYAFQSWKTEKDMRMSKHEIKEEMRMMEGDPEVRKRRRQIQLQMALKRMMGEVPSADVVITNPTHLAIAIKYDPNEGIAPQVVAKGAGQLAERIRALAVDNNIPIVERKTLAQALYKAVEVGDYVPEKFWQAVAEILAYVYRLAGKLQSVA